VNSDQPRQEPAWRVNAQLRALSLYRTCTPPAPAEPSADETPEPIQPPLVKGVTIDPTVWILVGLAACVVGGWIIGSLVWRVLL
jgi:hypothetical protein